MIAEHVTKRRYEVRTQTIIRITRVADRLIEAKRICDPVARKGIDHETLSVLRDDLLRRSVEVQDTFVDIDDVLDDRQLPVKTGLRDDRARIAGLKHDRLLRHADREGRKIKGDGGNNRDDACADGE